MASSTFFFCRELLQFNLSITATLGSEKSGHCGEVETRMNVWTVCQKKKWLLQRSGRCGEVTISGHSTVHAISEL